MRGCQLVNQVEDHVEIIVENEAENLVENDCVSLDDKDEAKKKLYQLIYAKEDLKKKLREYKSIVNGKKEHLELIFEIKLAYSKSSKDRSRREKYLFPHFAIFTIDSDDKLINKDQISEVNPLIYRYLENFYDDIKREHLLVGHGGLDKTHKQCKTVYANITVEVVNIWLQICVECILRTRKNTISGLLVKSIRSYDVLARGQVDLFNCEAYADGDFKYIMNYQDHFTKFIHLYSLKSKTPAAVAWHLLEIFLAFGAPSIL